jgi:ABC-type antimicrobial peptide transport system permease subunit
MWPVYPGVVELNGTSVFNIMQFIILPNLSLTLWEELNNSMEMSSS